MKNLSYKQIYEAYLDFFQRNGHTVIPSAPLVPENDPSVLFVNAGMFPLVPFLKGQEHPKGKRLVNIQRCIRTGDIEEVGNRYHCTAFIMLGNWSLNDYFKKEAINMTVEFFTKELGLDINNIYASVFEGDQDAPQDTESIEAWKEIFSKHGIDAKVGKGERIQPLGKKENWWGLESGGPCGPDSEIFYDTGKEKCGNDCNVSCNCGKYVEIGNNVFMEYQKDGDKITPLGRHNVDFGGGLERLTALLQNVDSVYDTDIYKPIMNKVKELSQIEDIKSQRVIVDHIKAATWIIMDGVTPSRTQQGYILRRLIRRAVRHGKKLGIENSFCKEIANIAIGQFKGIWEGLETEKENILKVIEEEEEKLITSAESLFSANSKDIRVRVEFSKNILAMVTSRKVGTLLIGLLMTSLNSSAVSKINSISAVDIYLIPNRCLVVNCAFSLMINQPIFFYTISLRFSQDSNPNLPPRGLHLLHQPYNQHSLD